MNFENPVWLIIAPLIVLSVAGLIAFGLKQRNALLSQFAAARLLGQLTEKVSTRRALVKGGLVLLAVALICISLARPQYGMELVERKARGLDIVFALDSSRSMLATDLRPTRLERAKLAIIDLVERLESDRIGLVVFAGNAFLQTPPTLDYSAFRESLKSVGPDSISRGGSNIGQALREAVKAFPKDDNVKLVVLLTDGEDLEEQAVDTARKVADDGIKVYSIGIGTPEGAYLKVRSENGGEEFIRDANGQPVRSRLDEATLQKISRLTGGNYSRLEGQSLETLYNSVLATLPREERESELRETPVERYQWLLLAAIFCLMLEPLIRRRLKASAQLITAFILLSVIVPSPSHADTDIQDAEERELSPKDLDKEIAPEKAVTDPRVIYNQAHKSLMKGNYAEARDLLKKVIESSDDILLERDALYNMGHAINQMGEEALRAQDFKTAAENWQRAEELFKSANELDPTDTASLDDAQQLATRRRALEEFLEQQKSQEQQMDNSREQNPQQDSQTESNPNEQGQNESPPNNGSSQSDDPQSDKSFSQEEQESSGENSSGQEQSEKKEDGTQSESTNPGETADDSTEQNPGIEESSEGKAEDRQQQNEEAVSENENENSPEGESDAVVPETTTQDATSSAAPESAANPENVNLSEARLLLDSLRNDEHLLPFSESTGENRSSRRQAETRNW